MVIRMVEIAMKTTVVTEHTANFGAKQYVQTLTTKLQTLSRNPTAQPQGQTRGLTNTTMQGKLDKLDASTKGAWKD